MAKFTELHRHAARLGYVDLRGTAHPYGAAKSSVVDHLRGMGWGPLLPGIWATTVERLDYATKCRAAVTYVGEPALLAGASVLHCQGVMRREPAVVELLLPSTRWVQARGFLRPRYSDAFETVRSQNLQGMRLARVARALRDHSNQASVSELCKHIAEAHRLRLCTLPQVEQELSGGRFPGVANLRQAYSQLIGELTHSEYERLGRRLLREAGVVVAAGPETVHLGGHPIAEIDIPFLDVLYGVEVDGPPHLLPAQAARDRARDRQLWRLLGIRIDRFMWFELEESPRRFVHEVVARLGELRSIQPATE